MGRGTVVFGRRVLILSILRSSRYTTHSGACHDTRNNHGQSNDNAPTPLVPYNLPPGGSPATATVSRSCRGDGAPFPWAYNTRGLGHAHRRLSPQHYLGRESRG